MDYLTNPTSRKDLRRLAPYLRKLFDGSLYNEIAHLKN